MLRSDSERVHRVSGEVELVERTSNTWDRIQGRVPKTTPLWRRVSQITRSLGEYLLGHPRILRRGMCGVRGRFLRRPSKTTEGQTDGQEMEGVIKGHTFWFSV